MDIAENIRKVRSRMADAAVSVGRSPEDIILVGASKTKPSADVRAAIAAGIDAVGENRVQELTAKRSEGAYEGVPLHFIGHLQRNKVRQIVGAVDLIQSVDSHELLRLIDARAGALGIVQDILLEVNIGNEASKSGISPVLLPSLLDTAAGLGSIRVRGLMSIPPISTESGGNRPYFAGMYKLFVDIGRKKYDNILMDFLSMGMSEDYPDAIMEGANMIRVGSAIFGARIYKDQEVK